MNQSGVFLAYGFTGMAYLGQVAEDTTSANHETDVMDIQLCVKVGDYFLF